MKTTLHELFLDWREGSVADALSKCSHHYSDKVLNPWHLEDDVLTHTEMVLNECGDNLLLYIPALCHDIGKIHTRKLNHERKRASFFGHEAASIQYVIDFIVEHADDIGIVSPNNFKSMLYMVNNHMVFHKANVDTLVGYCNHDPELFALCNEFALADSKGRTSDIKEIRDLKFEGVIMNHSVDDADIIWTCGVPGSGKDYIAEKRWPDRVIVSFDNIRVQSYVRNVNKKEWMGLNEKELYAKAWEWGRKKLDLTALTVDLVKKALANGQKVIIANTSCSIAARRGLIHALRGLGTQAALFVAVPLEVALQRNRSRTSKTIPDEAVVRFSREISLPTLEEGFIAVDVFTNA